MILRIFPSTVTCLTGHFLAPFGGRPSMRMKIVKMTFRMLRDESDSMGYFLPIMIFLGVPYGKVVNTITSIENQCNIYDGSYLSL